MSDQARVFLNIRGKEEKKVASASKAKEFT